MNDPEMEERIKQDLSVVESHLNAHHEYFSNLFWKLVNPITVPCSANFWKLVIASMMITPLVQLLTGYPDSISMLGTIFGVIKSLYQIARERRKDRNQKTRESIESHLNSIAPYYQDKRLQLTGSGILAQLSCDWIAEPVSFVYLEEEFVPELQAEASQSSRSDYVTTFFYQEDQAKFSLSDTSRSDDKISSEEVKEFLKPIEDQLQACQDPKSLFGFDDFLSSRSMLFIFMYMCFPLVITFYSTHYNASEDEDFYFSAIMTLLVFILVTYDLISHGPLF